MKDDTLQKSNTGFPSETGSPYYMELPTFSALIKNIEKKKKNPKCKISCVKNFISERMKLFGHNKRFTTCKPCPGYQPMHLNSTTRGNIIFKINPLDMVFPIWVSPPLTSQIPFSRLPTAKVHFPH